MVPQGDPHNAQVDTAPRTRGDGPRAGTVTVPGIGCSPHPRGWSRGLLPRPGVRRLLPAPAGMVPTTGSRRRTGSAAPRTRGDGPSVVPASARAGACSPHPRGWSPEAPAARRAQALLPAPAGMVPTARADPSYLQTAPRTRGDGPGWPTVTRNRAPCSPHPRGWSPRGVLALGLLPLLPAPAGMVPTSITAGMITDPAPRTRGDSPRLKGWRCGPRVSRSPDPHVRRGLWGLQPT